MIKAHGEEEEIKKELGECMKNIVIQKKRQAEEAKKREEQKKNQPKIQEVELPAEPKFKKI